MPLLLLSIAPQKPARLKLTLVSPHKQRPIRQVRQAPRRQTHLLASRTPLNLKRTLQAPRQRRQRQHLMRRPLKTTLQLAQVTPLRQPLKPLLVHRMRRVQQVLRLPLQRLRLQLKQRLSLHRKRQKKRVTASFCRVWWQMVELKRLTFCYAAPMDRTSRLKAGIRRSGRPRHQRLTREFSLLPI